MSNINDFGFPFTSLAGDRQYTSGEWREYFSSLLTNGVISNYLNACEVKPQTLPNKTVSVEPGAVFMQGAIRILETVQNLSIDENISGNPRIDRVVARLNSTERKIELAILKGTPASSPIAKPLTRNTSIWEIALADIYLANGFSSIMSNQITDTRINESICGYSKTIYMQEFDDENNLLKYTRNVTLVDVRGNPTRVEYKRDDNTIFIERTYTNPNANGKYQTITEKFYLVDGVTIYKIATYTASYLPNGVIDTLTRVVE